MANTVSGLTDIQGLTDFGDVVFAPRSLDYWCMGMKLTEQAFRPTPAEVWACLAPTDHFDGAERARQAQQLSWTLCGLVAARLARGHDRAL